MSESLSHGFGRVLVAVYAVFAVSATARALFQLAAKASEAPLAYSLSAVAGVVYIVATFALAREARPIATAAICFELAGVLGVGVASVFDAQWFADQSVWSDFGAGYGYVPLALPLIGLWWLRRTR